MAVTFTLNGKSQTVDVSPQMPLLWVLRDTLGMTGTKFGCGMALCGACTVHINGQPIRSCVTPISTRRRQERHHHRRSLVRQQPSGAAGLDRSRRAAVRLLPVRPDHDGGGVCSRRPRNPTDADIDEAMRGNICRCGTYQAIRQAVHLAAQYQAAANRRRRARRMQRRCGMSTTFESKAAIAAVS